MKKPMELVAWTRFCQDVGNHLMSVDVLEREDLSTMHEMDVSMIIMTTSNSTAITKEIRRTIERFTVLSMCYAKRRTSATPLTLQKSPSGYRIWAGNLKNAKRIDTNDFRPVFESIDNEELAPSPKLTRLARKLGIEHVIKLEKIEHTNDQG